jgi:uncharacterized membrane protein YfcA
MAEHREIPEPLETIQVPQPSWAPVFFALGAIGLLIGIYARGFMFPPWFYALVGLVLVLAAFRLIVRGSIRGYFRLPRKQHVRGAALPVETITAPSKRS